MIKNIIFDWSGVISDNNKAVYETVMSIFKKNKVRPLSYQEFRVKWRQPYMVFYRRYIPGIRIKDEQSTYRKIYGQMCKMHYCGIKSGLKRIMKQFRSQKIKMIVISSDPETHVRRELKVFGLAGYFLEIIPGIHNKYHILKKVIKDFSFKKNETIFIGDTNHEIEVAKKLGIKSGAVTWGLNTKEVLKKYKPDYIFHNVKELEQTILNELP